MMAQTQGRRCICRKQKGAAHLTVLQWPQPCCPSCSRCAAVSDRPCCMGIVVIYACVVHRLCLRNGMLLSTYVKACFRPV